MPRFPAHSLSSGPSARGTRVNGRKVLVLILAGGKGERLGVLTQERAKPALTFGGTYRLIDFALSNCMHSGVADVWVLEAYELHSLNDHLTNGRPWDLDRTYGGLEVLPPSADTLTGQLDGAGNADALHAHRHLIRSYAPDIVVVLSADHVYTLDYTQVIEHHLKVGAEVTMVTADLPAGEDARRFGNVTVTKAGRVNRFEYKPERPRGGPITTEVFVYDAPALLRTLDDLRRDTPAGQGLGDYGHALIPAFVKAKTAHAYPLDSYWRDVGLPEAYFRAHQDLLAGRSVKLDRPEWPVLSSSIPRMPARIAAGARVTDSLIAYGCRIEGTVTRSVLSPGVTVEAGAVVEDAVILRDVTVRRGARVRRAIVDEEADIAARVDGGPHGLSVIGARARVRSPVAGNTQVNPGQRR
ncbi:NTP transferase domain-containing protein [Deinococcus taeanensis]|uniref:glucose-1-phosphate adenylyltransferase family protein n=1 Tax=Deinococcus taeanensis TaxID=2737050 RepID=UPI001CDD6729|nr:sugar phosphate nucleotidyltransferase [Deinococcus taeanensis]UBV43157.1 NTP transferase domain-containing protein [Deinococcus taeanensis]